MRPRPARPAAEVGHEAEGVGVVGLDAAIIPEDQRVRGPDRPGGRAGPIGERERRPLVRHRDVDPAEAGLGQGANDGRERLGSDAQRDVVAGDPVFAEPVGEQHGRLAVADRKAADAGEKRPLVRHSVKRPASAEETEHLEKRQAEDGEIIALDAGEELRAEPFELVGADAGQRGVADPREVLIEKGI